MVGYKWVYLHTQHMIHVNEDFDVVNFTKKKLLKNCFTHNNSDGI